MLMDRRSLQVLNKRSQGEQVASRVDISLRWRKTAEASGSGKLEFIYIVPVIYAVAA
jgi:hypothetical protein